MTRFIVKIIAIVAVASLAFILFIYKPWLGVAEPPTTLTDLHDIAELQALFNQDERMPRLILLLSPT